MAAEPSIGRATRVERPFAPSADAAGDLYERYSAQILGYCLHQLGSREEAEDAVQTTFMNAFRGLSRGIVPELESAWLFKIAHNVCLSHRRSSWRRGKVEAPNNFEVLQEVIPGREQIADELIGLQDVLEEMPENQRRAILLREWQGLTYREISTELGLSQAAVETLIFRARRALAQGLEQDADTWKKRLRRGADVGGAIAFVKALLGGGGAAAVKVAATAIAVAATAVTAATDMPRHAHHASATKPAPVATRPTSRPATRLFTRRTVATISAPRNGSLSHQVSMRAVRPNSGLRNLPTPVSLPASHPDETISAAVPAPAPAASTPETPPAPAPSRPDAALPTAATAVPAPPPAVDPGRGSTKGNKDDRTPQATTQPTETTPTPPATPPSAQPPEQGQVGDESDKPATGEGDNSTGTTAPVSTNTSSAAAIKPDQGKGNDKAKGIGKDK